jgi:pimeloyl-ACP methyl ester carboxylesterase
MKPLSLLALILTLAACGTNLDARVVEVDGRAVEVVNAGEGTATVVFEAGLGNDWTAWDGVASDVALHAHAFAYSRPGYGKSAAADSPRDGQHIVDERRALLAAQGLAPPYVLVGHSFGGTYMELFAKEHPEDVAAVVLVDPRPRDFTAACEAAALESCSMPASLLWALPQVEQDEVRAFPLVADQIRSAGSFGAYPVRVLTASNHGESPAWDTLWAGQHRSLAAEADDGEQIVVSGGHALQTERRDEVVAAILAVIAP